MPRKSRKEMNSKFLHIMIQGINREYIFNKDKDIKAFLKILKEKIKKMDLCIIAYCIMNNHAHFLVYTEDIKLVSKLMKMVNTSYAEEIDFDDVYQITIKIKKDADMYLGIDLNLKKSFLKNI